MRRWITLCMSALILTGVCTTSSAQSPYALDKQREWIILGTGAAIGITALVLIDNVTPFTPEEIAALDPNDINDFDRRALEPYRETFAGDGFLYFSYALPLTFFTYTDTRQDWKMLGLMWVEASLLQTSINGLFKGAFKRTRPYAYDPDTPLEVSTARTARLSYYSGHTGTAATTTFFVARVFSDYLSSRRAKILIWTGAAVYPAITGALRQESGHHFHTDTITGYLIGAAIGGYVIPELHRVRAHSNLTLHAAVIQGNPGLEMQLRF